MPKSIRYILNKVELAARRTAEACREGKRNTDPRLVDALVFECFADELAKLSKGITDE